jgi:ribosomal protein S18 acetylase RimI-like enzyme
MFPKTKYPLTINQLKPAVNNRFDSTVILLDGEIVGFANFYEVKENRYCSIGNVVVNSNFRSRGIGEFIVKTMETTGIEKYYVTEFHISCFNTNTKGVLLYSKLGYEPYAIEKRINAKNEFFALIKLKRKT